MFPLFNLSSSATHVLLLVFIQESPMVYAYVLLMFGLADPEWCMQHMNDEKRYYNVCMMRLVTAWCLDIIRFK